MRPLWICRESAASPRLTYQRWGLIERILRLERACPRARGPAFAGRARGCLNHGERNRAMTIHQCPKCELRFNWKTEVDDHCWHDHPEFRHQYPARVVPHPVAEPAPAAPAAEHAAGAPATKIGTDRFIRWLVPRQPADQPRVQRPRTQSNTEPNG